MFRLVSALLVLVLGSVVAPAQSWVVRDPRPLLTSKLCWDSWRERGVLVAEVANNLVLHVHEWDGSRWTPRPAGGTVPQLTIDRRYAIGFDPVHHRTVLLSTGVQQAWAWDGQAWSTLPAPPFTPRWTTMSFHRSIDRMVVFDTGATVGQNATWHFDGATWTQVATGTQVDDVLLFAAYDAVRARTVLRAGNTTFEWDGSAWTGGTTPAQSPASAPIVFDPQRGKVIAPTTGTTHWEWSGSTWAPFAAPSANGGGQRPGMYFYDERRAGLVLYDDWSGTTQRLEASGWVVAERLPGTGGALQLTADAAHGRIVAVETPVSLNPNPPPTTLRWTPAGWQSLGHLGLPVRLGAAQADRDLSGIVYRFAGRTSAPISPVDTNELWAFDGTAWSLVAAPNAPTPRRSGALAVDTARQVLVSFGGLEGTTYWNDTREFDGVQWMPKYPAHAPSPRHGHAMCYSPALGRVFLFGGFTVPQGAAVYDFWAWDGTDWSQLPAPPVITQFALASHDLAGRVVLTAAGATPATWAWDGTAWSQLANAPIGSQMLCTEPRLGTVYAPYAGALLTMQPAANAASGSGCAGSVGTPTLRAFGQPGIGNGSYALEIETALAGPNAMLVAYGFLPATTPLPGGCTLLVTPVATQFLVAADGFGAFALPIPDDLALRGVVILAQGAVLDPAAAAGFATTSRLASTIGD